MDYGDPDGHGRHGILDDDGTSVLCHECGRRFARLSGPHLTGHGTDADRYRSDHGLSTTTPLQSAWLSGRLRESAGAQYASRPDTRAALAGGRALALRSGAGTRVARERAPERRGRAQERRRTSERISRVNRVRAAGERERQEAVAREDGYPDLASWLEANAGLTGVQIARRLGVSRSRATALRQEAVGLRRADAAVRADAVARVLAGERTPVVASQVGVGEAAVRAWVVADPGVQAVAAAAGWPSVGVWLRERSRVPMAQRLKAVREVLDRGESYAAVGRRYGVSDVTVAGWVRKERARPAGAATPRSEG
ncbi:helix-turn-helix domain-containing protein [Streptomyces sp. NPDC092296]|uniref:helix-turn-helix domain-containing protein n=1 Tax=Streptomyces sp. NPDC092296 TaxID=3366012 RepID=UPI003809A83A